MFSLDNEIQKFIEAALKKEGISLNDSTKLASAVKKLSDFYIHNPSAQTPWHESFARIAYISYFLPLNYLRIQRVATKCHERNFFNGIEHLVDFGAGLATASAALHKNIDSLKSKILIEKGDEPSRIIAGRWPEFEKTASSLEWHKEFSKNVFFGKSNILSVFSYSLTELTQLPDWAYESEALLIIEPATQEDGRKLLELRSDLVSRGFNLFAPCTHQSSCPLLIESKSDWCHDRVHVELPVWFQKMEEHLPIKNRTLTVSYLAARKSRPPALDKDLGRLTGDLLKENGKDRQLICRSEKREFLTWMHRHGEHAEHKRGDLYHTDATFEPKANELRVPKERFNS